MVQSIGHGDSLVYTSPPSLGCNKKRRKLQFHIPVEASYFFVMHLTRLGLRAIPDDWDGAGVEPGIVCDNCSDELGGDGGMCDCGFGEVDSCTTC